jgi:hypothetical protein
VQPADRVADRLVGVVLLDRHPASSSDRTRRALLSVRPRAAGAVMITGGRVPSQMWPWSGIHRPGRVEADTAIR